MLQPATPFDPWTATPAQALRAHGLHDPAGGEPAPLAQHQAAQEVMQARESCLKPDGGCVVMRCVKLCLLNGLTAPRWLSDAFAQRHSRVSGADVGSWDDAFGRPWPKRTRLAAVQKRMRLKGAVHAAVWRLLTEEPTRPIGRILFDEVGELPGIHVCGSAADRLYREALRDGMPNAIAVREALAA